MWNLIILLPTAPLMTATESALTSADSPASQSALWHMGIHLRSCSLSRWLRHLFLSRSIRLTVWKLLGTKRARQPARYSLRRTSTQMGRGVAAGLREEWKPRRLERISTSRASCLAWSEAGPLLATVTEAEGCLEEAAGRGILESRASGRQGICSLVHTFSAAGILNNTN